MARGARDSTLFAVLTDSGQAAGSALISLDNENLGPRPAPAPPPPLRAQASSSLAAGRSGRLPRPFLNGITGMLARALVSLCDRRPCAPLRTPVCSRRSAQFAARDPW